MDNIKKTTITCSICLSDPRLPVATYCGHIFCWPCLKHWLIKQEYFKCPICRKGIQMKYVFKIYTDKEDDNSILDDRPNSEEIETEKNNDRPNIIKRFFNNFGLFGVSNNYIIEEQLALPNPEEVKRNFASLGILIFAIAMIFFFFKY